MIEEITMLYFINHYMTTVLKIFMIYLNMFSQSLSRWDLLVTMWALMLKSRKMCFNMYSCVSLVPVSSVTEVTVPNP